MVKSSPDMIHVKQESILAIESFGGLQKRISLNKESNSETASFAFFSEKCGGLSSFLLVELVFL